MDARDIEQLYETYGPMVVRRCRAILGDEDEAADAAQEVFVRLIERADSLDLRGPSSLLYRMATNHCLNRIRASSRRPEVPNSELIFSIASLPEADPYYGDRVEMRSVLDRIFRRKKESTRLIAVLHWVEGMTLEEVAEEVDMSVSGVRKRLRQLKTRLGPVAHELDGDEV